MYHKCAPIAAHLWHANLHNWTRYKCAGNIPQMCYNYANERATNVLLQWYICGALICIIGTATNALLIYHKCAASVSHLCFCINYILWYISGTFTSRCMYVLQMYHMMYHWDVPQVYHKCTSNVLLFSKGHTNFVPEMKILHHVARN